MDSQPTLENANWEGESAETQEPTERNVAPVAIIPHFRQHVEHPRGAVVITDVETNVVFGEDGALGVHVACRNEILQPRRSILAELGRSWIMCIERSIGERVYVAARVGVDKSIEG